MPKKATVRFTPLQTSLVHLPLSIYSQLVARSITPQSLVVCLTASTDPANANGHSKGKGRQQEAKRAYVGWSGMSSRLVGGVKGPDMLEIDPVAAKELGLTEGMEVTIDLLRHLPAAQTVHVEPLTADDWEITELHAVYLETNLLSQVRAASPGSTLCVWVGERAKTLVRLRVQTIEPEGDVAVRLTNETEVVVAPKTRWMASEGARSRAEKEHHDLASGSKATQSTTKQVDLPPEVLRAKKTLLRLLPRDVAIPALKVLGQGDGENGNEAVAYVQPRHSQLLLQAYPSTKVSVRVKRCPACANGSSAAVGSSIAREGEDKSQAISSKGKEKAKEEGGGGTTAVPPARAAINVHLQSSPAVPEGSIWLTDHTRDLLDLSTDGYELLRLSKPVQTEGKEQDSAQLSEQRGVARIREDKTPFAGMQHHLDKALSHIRHTLAASRGLSWPRSAGQSTSALLVCGASGSGKTSLARRIAEEAKLDPTILTHVERLSCASLQNLRLPHLISRLTEAFTLSSWHAPSLLIFDDLDRLLPAEVEHIDSTRSVHIGNLFLNLASEATRSGVVILATAKGQESLVATVKQSHFFGARINLIAPDKDGRREIFASLLQAKAASGNSLALAPNLDYTSVSTQTEGYLPVDLKDLVDRSIHQSAIRASKSSLAPSSTETESGILTLTMADITSAQAGFTPLSLREVKLQKSSVSWADIGGLSETRRVLRETLEWPTKYAAIFASSPLRLRSGLLLYGFPGCGKTLLASAVAKECGLNFISVKGPEILNKYIGASEKSIRDLFERAQSARPCILFFDEFDSIAPKRGHDSTGVTDRVVNQLLTQMDGAEGLEGVYVLAATSRPDLIDPALLRPGRLDKSLLCDMPSETDRLEIMQACSRKIALSPDISLEDYVDDTEGYSGADLQALIYNAHLECVHSSISSSTLVNGKDKVNGINGISDGHGVEPVFRYTSFGGSNTKGGPNGMAGTVAVKSRAEQAKIQARLETIVKSLERGNSLADGKVSKAVPDEKKKHLVEPHHMAHSLRTTRPSVPRDEVRRLQRIYDEFVSARAKGGLPNGAASDEIGGRSSLM